MKVKTKEDIRQRLHLRIRKRLAGSPERPRLAVFRSQGHIYAQVIDDEAGRTLCAASSLDGELKAKAKRGSFTFEVSGQYAVSDPDSVDSASLTGDTVTLQVARLRKR